MAVKIVPEILLPRCSKCGYRKMIHIINDKEYLHCEHCESYDQISKDVLKNEINNT